MKCLKSPFIKTNSTTNKPSIIQMDITKIADSVNGMIDTLNTNTSIIHKQITIMHERIATKRTERVAILSNASDIASAIGNIDTYLSFAMKDYFLTIGSSRVFNKRKFDVVNAAKISHKANLIDRSAQVARSLMIIDGEITSMTGDVNVMTKRVDALKQTVIGVEKLVCEYINHLNAGLDDKMIIKTVVDSTVIATFRTLGFDIMEPTPMYPPPMSQDEIEFLDDLLSYDEIDDVIEKTNTTPIGVEPGWIKFVGVTVAH